MRSPLILTKLNMKFSTLAALMATTSAVKITQSTAAKTTETLATKIMAKTTESEPHYEINGTLKLVGDGAPAHEGPDMTDEMADADSGNNSISAASPHNPLETVKMENQNFRVGGQLDIILNPGPMGEIFFIDLVQDDNNWLYFEAYPKSAGQHGNCLYVHALKHGEYDGIEYCVKDDALLIEDLFADGPEIQL